MNSAREILISIAIKNKGEWQKILADIQAKNVEEKSFTTDQSCLTLVDQDYPTSLKQGYQPPFVLFYEGDIQLLHETNKLAVMSSRDTDTRLLAKLLDKQDQDITYVLGGTTENDKLVVSDYPNKAIVVLPYAIDLMDKEMKDQVLSKGGLVVSFAPNGTEKNKDFFIYQKILISNLTEKMLVIKCKSHSGTLVAVMNMLTLGKDDNVLIVPTSIEEEGYCNNQLIYEGATPVYNQETLRNELHSSC